MKMLFYCIRSEKANNIPDNNFNKFEGTFLIFATSTPIVLTSAITLPCKAERFPYYCLTLHNK